jgi:hypothetical protein
MKIDFLRRAFGRRFLSERGRWVRGRSGVVGEEEVQEVGRAGWGEGVQRGEYSIWISLSSFFSSFSAFSFAVSRRGGQRCQLEKGRSGR